MDGKQIDTYLRSCDATKSRYRGVYSITELQTITLHSADNLLIINSAQRGTLGHWIVIFLTNAAIVCFNSFAKIQFAMEPHLDEFLKQIDKPIEYSTKRLQQSNSCTCGAYCILVSVYLCKNYILCEILAWFSDDFSLNDKSVYKWLRTRIPVKQSLLLNCKGLK